MIAYLLSIVIKTRGSLARWFLSIALTVACLAAFSVLMSLLYCKIDFWITLGTYIGIMLPAAVVMFFLLLRFFKTDKRRTEILTPFVILGALIAFYMFIIVASESALIGTPLFAGESSFSLVVWIFMLLLTIYAMRTMRKKEKVMVKAKNEMAPAQDNIVMTEADELKHEETETVELKKEETETVELKKEETETVELKHEETEADELKHEETEAVELNCEEPDPGVKEPPEAPKVEKKKNTRRINVRRLMLAAFCLVAMAASCYTFLSPSELGENVYVERRSSTSRIVHSKENCKEISGGIMKKETKEALKKIGDGSLLYCNKCMSDEMISRYSESQKANEMSESDHVEYEYITVPDYEAADSAAAPNEDYSEVYREETRKVTDYIFLRDKNDIVTKVDRNEFAKNPNAYRDYSVRMRNSNGVDYAIPFEKIDWAIKQGLHVYRLHVERKNAQVAQQKKE